MFRWLLVLVLTVASATAWAQSTNGLTDATTRAWNTSVAAEQTLARATGKWNEINTRFRAELDEVGRLKNAPRSWRRDRDLRAKMSDADATGSQLATASADVRKATEGLAAARKALIAAIDTELAAGPAAPRRAQLDKARAQVVPATRTAHRIVLPDTTIDQLADPEELDQQAIAIRDTEVELDNQVKSLEARAKKLDQVAMLRKQSDRARELDQQTDNSARKGSTPSGGRGGESSAAPPAPSDSGGPANPGSELGAFESDAKITLADVVDRDTIAELDRAQRSNDPAKRATAVRLTRDVVARRLAQLRDKRKQVENRATQLRKSK